MNPFDTDPNTEEEAPTVLIGRPALDPVEEADEATVACGPGATQVANFPSGWGVFVKQQLREHPWLTEEAKGEAPLTAPKPPVQPRRPKRPRTTLRDYLTAFAAVLGLTAGVGTCADLILTVARPPEASNIADVCPEGMSPGSWILHGGKHVLYSANTPVARRASVEAMVPGSFQKSFSPQDLWNGCVPNELKDAVPKAVQFFAGEDTGTYRFVFSSSK